MTNQPFSKLWIGGDWRISDVLIDIILILIHEESVFIAEYLEKSRYSEHYFGEKILSQIYFEEASTIRKVEDQLFCLDYWRKIAYRNYYYWREAVNRNLFWREHIESQKLLINENNESNRKEKGGSMLIVSMRCPAFVWTTYWPTQGPGTG